MQDDTTKRLVGNNEAAEYCGIAGQTLALWRSQRRKNQPPYIKMSRAIRYRISDLDAWLASNTVGTVTE
jgi:predicted DNA-binding transcriptional regulator AlpA